MKMGITDSKLEFLCWQAGKWQLNLKPQEKIVVYNAMLNNYHWRRRGATDAAGGPRVPFMYYRSLAFHFSLCYPCQDSTAQSRFYSPGCCLLMDFFTWLSSWSGCVLSMAGDTCHSQWTKGVGSVGVCFGVSLYVFETWHSQIPGQLASHDQ